MATGGQLSPIASLSQNLRRQYLCYGFIGICIRKQQYIIPDEIKKLCFIYLNHLDFKIYTDNELSLTLKYQNALQDKRVITKFQNVLQQKYGDNATEFRVEVYGGGGVGKSAITIRYVMDDFFEEYDPTLEDSYRKCADMYGTIMIWDILDTAGQEEYTSLQSHWLREINMVILVYSIISRDSFEEAQRIRGNIMRYTEEDERFRMILVGNKVDLKDSRQISFEEGFALAQKWRVPFIESSAKTGENIDEIFKLLLMHKLDVLKAMEEETLDQTRCNCILL